MAEDNAANVLHGDNVNNIPVLYKQPGKNVAAARAL